MQNAPNAAMLIDFDNVHDGAIRSDLQAELKNLLSSESIKGKVCGAPRVCRLAPLSAVHRAADGIVHRSHLRARVRQRQEETQRTFVWPSTRWSWCSRVRKSARFILLSGDSDFSSMVIKLKEYGKYVIGVGIRESSSDLLVMNCGRVLLVQRASRPGKER